MIDFKESRVDTMKRFEIGQRLFHVRSIPLNERVISDGITLRIEECTVVDNTLKYTVGVTKNGVYSGLAVRNCFHTLQDAKDAVIAESEKRILEEYAQILTIRKMESVRV
jgi:hypothetical protein